jgi:uncharacterized OsmC-like protein
MKNPLVESGLPLFFRVADPPRELAAPRIRLGEAIRVVARSLSLMQKEALVISARTGAVWRLASDEGAYLAGFDTAPCPLSFLTTGMVSSTLNELYALASRRGIALERVRLVQDNYYTMKGSILQGTMRGGTGDVRLIAQIDSRAGGGDLAQLVQDAVVASPVNGLLRESLQGRFTLDHNGRSLQLTDPASTGIPIDSDPLEYFDRRPPEAGEWDKLIRRGEMTPQAAHTVTLSGGSLAPEQNRLLHVRGICTLRDDGMKLIEQQLFNPHGSMFYFQSEEAPVNGGQGRAPDALTYAASGIAFCFMTQIGRYASIARQPLQSCRIIQDVHFSLGGATGGTGQPGTAEPVETHVYLQSEESDASALHMLVMAEQTCFLHALCKSLVETRVAVLPWSDDIPSPQLQP